MRDDPEMKTYTYSGVLAPICEGFVQEKRAVGCLYNTEAKKLSEFSRFTLDFDYPEGALPKEIVQAWIAKKSADSDRNQYAGFSLISQFAKYMEWVGYPAYVPGWDEIGKLHELTGTCTKYAKTRIVGPPRADWFFAAPNGGHYGVRTVCGVFRDLLWKDGISHGGKGTDLRLHDFRQTFCVHSLQR